MSLTTGLVSYWKLDETSDGSGAVTREDSHGANDLTDNNTTPSGTGKINNGIDITKANSEFLSVADNATLDFTTTFSISAWINVDNLPSAEDLGIIAKWDYQTQGSWAIQMDNDNADEIQIYIADSLDDTGDASAYTQNANIAVDTWYHLVVLYNGGGATNADKLKCYVNNTANTLSFTGTIPSSLQNSTASLKIGNFGGTLTRYFDGLIDEVGIWNRVLTTGEITQLYNSGNGLAYSGFPEGGAFLYNFI